MRLKFLILLSGALVAQPLCAQEQDGPEGLGTVSFDFPIRDEYIAHERVARATFGHGPSSLRSSQRIDHNTLVARKAARR